MQGIDIQHSPNKMGNTTARHGIFAPPAGNTGCTVGKQITRMEKNFQHRDIPIYQGKIPFDDHIPVTISMHDSIEISRKRPKTATGLQFTSNFSEQIIAPLSNNKPLKNNHLKKTYNKINCHNGGFFHVQLSLFTPKTAHTFVSSTNMLHFFNNINMNSFSTPNLASNLPELAPAITALRSIIVVDIVSAVRPPGGPSIPGALRTQFLSITN